jgi:hypothetical protein
VKVAELIRGLLFGGRPVAPSAPSRPARVPELGPPPPPDEELRWARREAEAILRRARALEIEVDLERAIR